MNRSLFYLRASASLHDYLWSSPGDRWLGMWQYVANSTPDAQITTFALEHRRYWRDQGTYESSQSLTPRSNATKHVVISSFKTRW